MHANNKLSRKERSRSPYRSSRNRHKIRSPTQRRHGSTSTSPRRQRHKRHGNKSASRSPTRKLKIPSPKVFEHKQDTERACKEEDKK
ncbi:hypothetical protein KI387_016677, partial [Taxus chinensis]